MARRINFMISKDLGKRFDAIPWGMRSAILRKMVEKTCIAFEKDGHKGIASFLDDQNLNDRQGA